MRTTPLDVISVHYAAHSALAALLIVAVVVVALPAAVTVTGGARKYAMQFFYVSDMFHCKRDSKQSVLSVRACECEQESVLDRRKQSIKHRKKRS